MMDKITIDTETSLSTLKCPITHQLFCYPVMAEDGQIYEKLAIEQWFKTNGRSPMTNSYISKNLKPIYPIKNLVEELVNENPNLKEEQYPPFSYNEFEANKELIVNLIKNRQWNQLTKYVNIDLKYLMEKEIFTPILSSSLISYIFDNCLDINCINGVGDQFGKHIGWYPIHYICKYGSTPVIKLIINRYKNINLEVENGDGRRPIIYICRFKTPELIQIMESNGINMECVDNNGWRPIHYICRHQPLEVVKYMVEKGVDLECENQNGWRPIHFICRYGTPETVKYAFESKKFQTDTTIKKYFGEDVEYGIFDLTIRNPKLNGQAKISDQQKN
jgi:hypothetical protein